MNGKLAFSAFTVLLLALVNISSAQYYQQPLPQSVINVMASRQERYHHFLWHNIRENWNRLSSSSQREIRNLGWAPPRPSRRYDSSGNSITITDNDSGEDFLYMHRQMIVKVNQILAQNGEPYGQVTGWKTLPTPGDREWPVPPSYTVPGNSGRTSTIKKWKSTSFYNDNIRSMEKTLTNPKELRKMTLGEFGAKIEVTVHSWFHLRMSEESPVGYRPSTTTGLPDIDRKYDDPSYNWLADTYSSHVHPTFWNLHGWVDDRIEDWRKANGLSSIKWKGTWEGGPMSSISNLFRKQSARSSLRVPNHEHGDQNAEEEDDTMMQVARIFAKEGFDTSFADPVFLEAPKILKKSALKSKVRICRKKATKKRN